MATPDRTLLTEANVNDLSPLGAKLNDTSARLNVVEVATGTQYGNVPTLTNVTEIPTDVSGRIDLVYTQPTTVHFANPGLTDIVLSIEGYEHITWEGVSVHGTPNPTAVVWASAMWRDRDSTWHLLCEQDASQGGGGSGMRLVKFESPMLTYGPVPGGPVDEKGLPTTFETTLLSQNMMAHYEMVTTFIDPTTGDPREAFVDFLPPGSGFTSTSSLDLISFTYLDSAEEPTEGLMFYGSFRFKAGKWTLQGGLYVMDGFTFPNTGVFRVASAEMVPDFLGIGILEIPIPTPWGGIFTLQIWPNVGVVLAYPAFNSVTGQTNPPIPPATVDPEDPDGLKMHAISLNETGTFPYREVRLPDGGAS